MTSPTLALRRISSVALAVSFVAVAGSGLLMLAFERLELRLRMHPVHEVLGMVMAAAGIAHLALNWRPMLAHLRVRWSMVLGFVLAGVAALLVLGGITHPVDRAAMEQIEAILRTSHLDAEPE